MPRAVSAAGQVRSVHLKPETHGERGLPKLTVPKLELTRSGVSGDFNRYRHEEKHDDEAMALLLLPEETLDELVAEGWPVGPGHLGENVTTRGVHYAEFWPGRRFRVGEAEVVITKACDPCDNLYLLPYVGSSKGPEFLRTTLGRRGWYARVAHGGWVRPGDEIRSIE